MVAAACHPIELGPDGRPVFAGAELKHTANEPFSCFSLVDSKGGKTTRCFGDQPQCADGIERATAAGLTVLSACTAAARTYCTERFGGGSLRCARALEECDAARSQLVSIDSDNHISSCTPVEKTKAFPR
jgi:hypothetical protein